MSTGDVIRIFDRKVYPLHPNYEALFDPGAEVLDWSSELATVTSEWFDPLHTVVVRSRSGQPVKLEVRWHQVLVNDPSSDVRHHYRGAAWTALTEALHVGRQPFDRKKWSPHGVCKYSTYATGVLDPGRDIPAMTSAEFGPPEVDVSHMLVMWEMAGLVCRNDDVVWVAEPFRHPDTWRAWRLNLLSEWVAGWAGNLDMPAAHHLRELTLCRNRTPDGGWHRWRMTRVNESVYLVDTTDDSSALLFSMDVCSDREIEAGLRALIVQALYSKWPEELNPGRATVSELCP